MAALTGGDKLMAALAEIDARLGNAGTGPSVRVGFLSDAFYPDGTSVAAVAAWNEFGSTINRAAGKVTVFRKVAAAGTHFLRNGRFVKQREANFSSTHAHGAYTITIPPRPFFRNMIKEKAKSWPDEIAKLLKANKFDAAKTLKGMGDLIKGQLQSSIIALTSPPLAASTIRAKSRGRVTKIAGVLGPAKPLIWTGEMLRRVDYEVST